MYKKAGLLTEEFKLPANANDVEKRTFFTKGFHYMRDNVANPALACAKSIDKNIYNAYQLYIKSDN